MPQIDRNDVENIRALLPALMEKLELSIEQFKDKRFETQTFKCWFYWQTSHDDPFFDLVTRHTRRFTIRPKVDQTYDVKLFGRKLWTATKDEYVHFEFERQYSGGYWQKGYGWADKETLELMERELKEFLEE